MKRKTIPDILQEKQIHWGEKQDGLIQVHK